MSKNIEAKAGNLTDLNYKLDLQNFGVDKIYVITDFENTARKEAFIEAWNNFKGFDYCGINFIPTCLYIWKMAREYSIMV